MKRKQLCKKNPSRWIIKLKAMWYIMIGKPVLYRVIINDAWVAVVHDKSVIMDCILGVDFDKPREIPKDYIRIQKVVN